jgi:hypothetical protein
MPQPFTDEGLRRYVRKLEDRIAKLEAMVIGMRAERRARLRVKRDDVKAVVVDSPITAGGSGWVEIWRNGAPTAETVQAHLNWAHSGQDIPVGGQIWIRFHADENKWVITGRECE